MSNKVEIKHYKVKSIIDAIIPNSVFYVKGDNENSVKTYITDLQGTPYPLRDLTGVSGGITTLTSTDGSITITGTQTTKNIQLSAELQNLINTSLRNGDLISSLINDAGYLTSSDIVIPNLQEVTTAGNEITNDIIIKASDPFNYIKLDKEEGSVKFYVGESPDTPSTLTAYFSSYGFEIDGSIFGVGRIIGFDQANGLKLKLGATEAYYDYNKIRYNGVNYLLPNTASSRIATLLDIPSIPTPLNLQTTTDNGSSTTNPIEINSTDAFAIRIRQASNKWFFANADSVGVSNFTNSSFASLDTSTADPYLTLNKNGKVIQLKVNDSQPTGTIVLSAPLSSGTLALLSDIISPSTILTSSITNGDTSHAPTGDAVFDALALKLNANSTITGATKTKITYDSNGLITSGTDATTSDITEGSNLYFTNARVNTQLNTYTGDVTFSSGVSSIGALKVTNAMLAGSIAYSKLSLTNSIVNGDIVSLSWSKLTSTPTTLSGYSITDAQPLDSDLTSWAAITRASGFDTFAATPNSANLASLITDETGSGSLVFGTSPTLSNPVVGTQSQGDNSTKAASTAYVDTLGSLRTKSIVKDLTTSSNVTGSLETLCKTYPITAGTFSSSDFLNIIVAAEKSVSTNTNNFTIRIKINSTNNFSTATTIATATSTNASSPWGQLGRHFELKQSTIKGIHFTSFTGFNDMISNGNLRSSTTLDTTADFWIYVSIQIAGTGETCVINSVSITN